MFDLVAGFCHSQILLAFVRLELPQLLLRNEMTLEALSAQARVVQNDQSTVCCVSLFPR